MSKQNVTVEVEKEAYDLSQGLVQFVRHVKKALDDGWQPGSDLPVILSATLTDLVPAVQNMNALGADLAESEAGVLRAFELSANDLLYVFRGPK